MGTGRGTLIAVAMAIALLVAGCGGGDSSTAANSISKEEFITKADAICKKGSERMQAAIARVLKRQRNITKVTKGAQEKIVATVMVPSVSREIKELRAIGIPDGDAERVNGMIAALEEGVETGEQDPEAVIKSSDAIFGIASRIAGEYGLAVCGGR
jgi:arginine repressor